MTGRAGLGKTPLGAKSGAEGGGTFGATVHNITAESGGLLDLLIVRPVDLPFVIAEATAGTPDAVMLLIALDAAVARITAASRRSPMLCTSCPRPLLRKTHYSFCIVLPSREDPTNGLALVVCSKCAVTVEEIKAKGVVGLRRIWPGLHQVDITHPTGGRA